MGGRGSSGLTGGGNWISPGAQIGFLGTVPDNRESIQTMFVDELGFSAVLGTSNIPTATLGSYAIALNSLEREYGAIAASDDPTFMTGAGGSVQAAVISEVKNPASQALVINQKALGDTSSHIASAKASEVSGWHAQTSGSLTALNAYTVTHEYGHMLHNALAAKAGMSTTSFTAKAASEIKSLAKSYGATSSVSIYGTTNSAEFFAETFASYNLGGSTAYTRAMGEWLTKNSLK